MSANEKMPELRIVQHKDYNQKFEDSKFKMFYNNWLNSLKPCEISESELCLILSNVTKLDYDNPIEVTDIVELDKSFIKNVILFKHPKQVEEIEAIYTEKQVDELIETICFRLRSGHFKTLDLKLSAINRIKNEDYTHWKNEIFKNQKQLNPK